MALTPKIIDPLDGAAAQILRYAAKSRALSYRDIQAACGVKNNRIGIIFREERPATLGEIKRLCTALDVDFMDLAAACLWIVDDVKPRTRADQVRVYKLIEFAAKI